MCLSLYPDSPGRGSPLNSRAVNRREGTCALRIGHQAMSSHSRYDRIERAEGKGRLGDSRFAKSSISRNLSGPRRICKGASDQDSCHSRHDRNGRGLCTFLKTPWVLGIRIRLDRLARTRCSLTNSRPLRDKPGQSGTSRREGYIYFQDTAVWISINRFLRNTVPVICLHFDRIVFRSTPA